MKEFKGKLDEGPMKRLPTLAMVGGRCLMFTIKEEVSSSLAQRATFSFKGVGWRRCFGFERIGTLCDVAKGRANDVQSPSHVTSEDRGAGVTTRPHESTPCGPPHGHGTLHDPERLHHLLLLVTLIFKQFFKTTAAALVVLLQLQF